MSVIVFSHRQGHAPRGPTKRIFYLRALDHLRILKMLLLCKIKQLLNEDEYVMKNYYHPLHHHHHGHCYY